MTLAPLWQILAPTAAADPLHPYGAAVTTGQVSLNPSIEVDTDGWMTPAMHAGFGPVEGFDLWLGGGPYRQTGSTFDGGYGEVLARVFPWPETDLALVGRAIHDTDTAGTVIGPEGLAVIDLGEIWTFWANAGVLVGMTAEPMRQARAEVVLAPELWLGPMSLSVEFAPVIPLASDLDAPRLQGWVVPGASVWFGPEETQGVAFGVLVPMAPTEHSLAFSAWYSVDVGRMDR